MSEAEKLQIDIEKYNLSQKQVHEDAQFAGFRSFIRTPLFERYLRCTSRIKFFDTGNKYGKTISVAYDSVLRCLGLHPVPRRNVLYFRCEEEHEFSPVDMIKHFPGVGPIVETSGKERCPQCDSRISEVQRVDRVFRFASATLPKQGDDNYHKKTNSVSSESIELSNVQHPAFKKVCPPMLINKDCTQRVQAIQLNDVYGRGMIQCEFTSFGQKMVQKTGFNRMWIWGDEQAPYDEFSDWPARIIFERGDIIITCTPIDYISFYYDDVFLKAKEIYRTKTICNFLELEYGRKFKQYEKIESSSDITVFWAATDDNPLLPVKEVDALFPNDGTIMNKVKRYGLFHQISGRIFPEYSDVVIVENEEIGENLAFNCVYWDWHSNVDHAIGFLTLTSTNEVMVWGYMDLSPHTYTTEAICLKIAEVLEINKVRTDLCLIDPLSNTKQGNTRNGGQIPTTVLDDINDIFGELYTRGEINNPVYFETWDTKSTYGREQIRSRLRNSSMCGKPYNNIKEDVSGISYLPTIWFEKKCVSVYKSIANWSSDKDGKPKQKWSHHCTGIEGIMKDQSFVPRKKLDLSFADDLYENCYKNERRKEYA